MATMIETERIACDCGTPDVRITIEFDNIVRMYFCEEHRYMVKDFVFAYLFVHPHVSLVRIWD